MKLYDRAHNRLIQISAQATPEFWDQQWAEGKVASYSDRAVSPFVRATNKYLEKGSSLLEGGCGNAGKISALTDAGYRVVGVDFAENTVCRVKSVAPHLDVRLGDVFDLPFDDGEFDGYWSFGVIEHFWLGYDGILEEANRVLRKGGYVFITFPSMSLLRSVKAKLGMYDIWQHTPCEPEGFYQYYLSSSEVCSSLVRNGFVPVKASVLQASYGIKRELRPVWRLFSRLNTRLPLRTSRFLESCVEIGLSSLVGHISLVVAVKESEI